MWNAIQYVTGGLALVAFLAAAAVFVVRRKLRHDEEMVRLAPDTERAQLIMTRWGSIDVQRGNFTRDQKKDLALQQIIFYHRQYGWAAILIAFIAVLLASVTVYAISKSAELTRLETRIDEINSVKLELERRIKELEHRRFLVTRDVSKITGEMSIYDDPEVKRLVEKLERAIGELNSADVRSLPPRGLAQYREAEEILDKFKQDKHRIGASINLTWPKMPADLDLHLQVVAPDRRLTVNFKYPGKLDTDPWIYLDRDIIHNPGTETIRVMRWLQAKYYCVVCNYSGEIPLAGCGAIVTFEHRGQIRTFHCPASGHGLWWVVFQYDFSTNIIEEVNSIRDKPPLEIHIDR